MSFEKENFLRTKLVSYLQQLPAVTHPLWGKMNVQQMVEHLVNDAVRVANGQRKFETIISPPEHLAKLQAFITSDKPFRENTKNPLLGEIPAPLIYNTLPAAIGALQEELITFFEVFEKDHTLTTRNPVFGDLDFEMNVQLLYKHSIHHLRQFGVQAPRI
jgi:hypothetical protein